MDRIALPVCFQRSGRDDGISRRTTLDHLATNEPATSLIVQPVGMPCPRRTGQGIPTNRPVNNETGEFETVRDIKTFAGNAAVPTVTPSPGSAPNR